MRMRRVSLDALPDLLILPPMRAVKRLTILLIGLICVGCGKVQRTMSINSDPPGALVYMNDLEIGRTPVTKDFTWYGTYEVVVRKEGYQTLKTTAAVIAPVWQWPPFDLAAEFSPARLKDKHDLNFKLEPETGPPPVDEMLGRAEQARVQLESTTFVKAPSTKPATRPTTQTSVPTTQTTTTQQ